MRYKNEWDDRDHDDGNESMTTILKVTTWAPSTTLRLVGSSNKMAISWSFVLGVMFATTATFCWPLCLPLCELFAVWDERERASTPTTAFMLYYAADILWWKNSPRLVKPLTKRVTLSRQTCRQVHQLLAPLISRPFQPPLPWLSADLISVLADARPLQSALCPWTTR